jgi:hypothetical protein
MRLPDDGRAEHPLDVPLDVVDVAARLLLGVDFDRRQPRRDLALARSDPLLEDVRGGVRRIGRDEQDSAPAAAGRQREGGRAGRLADAALAADEEERWQAGYLCSSPANVASMPVIL